MGKYDLANSSVGDMTTNRTDYSVDTVELDSPSGQKEYSWTNSKFTQYMGYYKTIAELGAAIDAKGFWTVGKGYKADEKTKFVLKKITGWGKDTFNTIMENCVRMYNIGGDSFCEIIKDSRGRLVNLKPLNPRNIKIVVNEKGMILRYEQTVGDGAVPVTFKPDQIFHLAWNRLGDEIHGTSIIQKIENIILMRNEAMSDLKVVFHRYVKPLWIWKLDTDDATKIAAFKAKADQTVENAENIYVPKGAAEADRVSIPQYSTLDPLPWIENLTQYFFQATGIPDVVLGSAKQTVEASAKILYLAFQQSIEKNQLFLEENIEAQLGLEVNFEFPASLELPTKTEMSKEGNPKMEKKETSVSMEGKK